MNAIETYLEKRLVITDVDGLRESDRRGELIKTFIENGLVKLKDGAKLDSATYDDVEMVGNLVRTRSEKHGVRWEWAKE